MKAEKYFNEIKQTLSIGIPFMGTQFIYSVSFFISTAMVARLGKEALAASVLVSSFWFTLTTFFVGIVTSVSILVAHQYGAKNNKGISEIMGQALLLGLLVSILDILILMSFPFFLHWIAQPPEVLHMAKQYLHALPWCVPGLFLLVISGQFLGSIGHPKIVFRISVLVILLELPIMYLLIFGKWGLPMLGVAGVGYAYAITNTIAAIGLIYYLKISKTYQHYGIFNQLGKINFLHFKEFIQVGLPMGFMHLIEVGAFALSALWMAQFGTTWLAAHQITLQYLTFFITTIVFAMSQTVSVRVGHAVGCQDHSAIKRAIAVGMLISFFIMTVVAGIFCAFPEALLSVDIKINDPANALLIKYASSLLSICALLFLFDSFRMIGFGALRGLKDTRFPMIASFFSFFIVALMLAYELGFSLNLKGKGIWWGLTIGIAVGSMLILIRLKYYLKWINLAQLLKINDSYSSH